MNDRKGPLEEERGKEKVHRQKRYRKGEKQSGIYFHLSTALKAINTYRAWSSGTILVCECVFVGDG